MALASRFMNPDRKNETQFASMILYLFSLSSRKKTVHDIPGSVVNIEIVHRQQLNMGVIVYGPGEIVRSRRKKDRLFSHQYRILFRTVQGTLLCD